MDDVPAAVRHYRDVLGFSANYEQHDIGVLDRDEVRLLLVQRTPSTAASDRGTSTCVTQTLCTRSCSAAVPTCRASR